jgi:hypothetical protein
MMQQQSYEFFTSNFLHERYLHVLFTNIDSADIDGIDLDISFNVRTSDMVQDVMRIRTDPDRPAFEMGEKASLLITPDVGYS